MTRKSSWGLAAILVLAVGGCMANPLAQADAVQMITDMSDAIAELQQENAAMQMQLDSIRTVTARQDTLIARIAAVTGVPIPPR